MLSSSALYRHNLTQDDLFYECIFTIFFYNIFVMPTIEQDTELKTGNEEKNREKQTNQPKPATGVINQTKQYTIGIVSK